MAGRGEANVDQGASAEINAVIEAVMAQNGEPADGQKDERKADEVLRLAHPIDIDVMKEFHAQSYPLFFDTVRRVFVPGRRAPKRHP